MCLLSVHCLWSLFCVAIIHLQNSVTFLMHETLCNKQSLLQQEEQRSDNEIESQGTYLYSPLEHKTVLFTWRMGSMTYSMCFANAQAFFQRGNLQLKGKTNFNFYNCLSLPWGKSFSLFFWVSFHHFNSRHWVRDNLRLSKGQIDQYTHCLTFITLFSSFFYSRPSFYWCSKLLFLFLFFLLSALWLNAKKSTTF